MCFPFFSWLWVQCVTNSLARLYTPYPQQPHLAFIQKVFAKNGWIYGIVEKCLCVTNTLHDIVHLGRTEKSHWMGKQTNEWTIFSWGNLQLIAGLGLRTFKNSPYWTRQVHEGIWQCRDTEPDWTQRGFLYTTLFIKVVLALESTTIHPCFSCPQTWVLWIHSIFTSAHVQH